MNPVAPTLLAAAFLAGSVGMALAANAPSAAPPAAAPHAAHHQAAARRQSATDTTGARMTTALNLLEAKGYGGFSNFKQNGKTFVATVSQNGQHFDVVVDPDTGQVTRQG